MKIKKTVLFLLSVSIVANFLCLSPLAEERSYSWYCAHVKDHKQPAVAKELAFAEDCEAYYIDHTHASENDGEKVIYLTFDAGYENGNVAKILDVLKEEGVSGAFFVLGHLISKNPDLIMRMKEEGHLVCNHTVRHRDMSGASEEELLEELKALEAQYKALTGEEMPKYYRPPEGKFSRSNLEALQRNGYKTVFWSFAYPDWDNQKQMSAEKAKRIILDNLHNGEIMLLHPTSAVNAEILGDVIREAKSLGYRFGTLDELTGGLRENG